MFARYKQELDVLKSNSCERVLSISDKKGKYLYNNGQSCLNLSSNDYLGIAENQEIINDFLNNNYYSLGSASSRLLTGGSKTYFELEALLAKLYNKEGALLFNSGYHANTGIMPALLNNKDVVFCDKLNHASLLDGIQLSKAKMFRYKHLDYQHLEELLSKYRCSFENAIIVTEALFSMDGDYADLRKLIELKKKYNCLLIVDEAHSFGVLGNDGLGLSQEQDCINDIDLLVATFGKAIGSVGAFCVGCDTLIKYLINKCRSLIFSTALPDINIAFSHFVISEILPKYRMQRKELLKTSQKLRMDLAKYNLKTVGESHIVPVILGENEIAVKISKELIMNGYYLLPIRHPTVAKGSSRVRISLRADVMYSEVNNIAKIINQNI